MAVTYVAINELEYTVLEIGSALGFMHEWRSD